MRIVFDNGELRYDPVKGHKMMDDLLSILDEGQEDRPPATPLIYVHDTIWIRVLKVRELMMLYLVTQIADQFIEFAKRYSDYSPNICNYTYFYSKEHNVDSLKL